MDSFRSKIAPKIKTGKGIVIEDKLRSDVFCLLIKVLTLLHDS